MDVSGKPPVRSWVATLLALLLGTVGTLALAEVGFRLLEPLLDRSTPSTDGEITLLAEGDSFTYGIGGLSFPQQLDEVLAERLGERRYRTVNLGIPGLNTAALADRLELDLLRYRPAAVLVVIGENNSWNTIRTEEAAPGWLDRIDQVLLHSRVYKFARVATIGWRHNTFHEAAAEAEADRAVARGLPATHAGDDAERVGLFPTGEIEPGLTPVFAVGAEGEAELRALVPLGQQGRYAELAEAAAVYVEKWPAEPLGYHTLAASQARLGLLPEAAATLRRCLEVTGPSPMHEDSYFVLANVLSRDERLDEAIAVWKQGLAVFPQSRALFWAYSNRLYQDGRAFEALELASEVPEVRSNDLFVYLEKVARDTGVAVQGGVDAQVKEATREDVRRMVALARAHGAAIVFGSYPDIVHPEVAEVAAELGVPFVDFRPHFQARFTSREQYISNDRCHCNSEGYRLMAEVFADEVQKLGISP